MVARQPKAPDGRGGLSGRETEVVALVAEGLTDQAIADQLYISVRTVRSHLDRIRDKTGCRRRSELTRLALSLATPTWPEVAPAKLAGERWIPADDERLPFAGRDNEMDRLLALVQRAAVGRPAVGVVAGEAGVGKTRLLQEFAVRCSSGGGYVTWASAEDDDVLPYRAFADIVRAVVSAPFGPACLDRLGGLVEDLATLVPGIAPFEATLWSADAEVARARLFEAVCTLVGHAAEAASLVIVIDDAHSMGRATTALVRSLLGAAPRGRMAVIAGFRTGRVDDRARLNDLFHDHAPELMGLERLTEAGIAACLGAGRGLRVASPGVTATPEAIYRLTGGLPLLLQELLRRPGPDGDWTGTPGTPALGVADVVSERTKRIDEEQRMVLDVAAVSGRIVRAGTIAAVTGQDPGEVGALLEAVRAQAGLIAPGAGPGSYVWDHALLRQAVLDGVADGRLNQLHHDLSRVLVEEGSAIPAARHALVALRVLQRSATVTVLAGVDEAIDSLAFEVGEELCRSALLAAGGRCRAGARRRPPLPDGPVPGPHRPARSRRGGVARRGRPGPRRRPLGPVCYRGPGHRASRPGQRGPAAAMGSAGNRRQASRHRGVVADRGRLLVAGGGGHAPARHHRPRPGGAGRAHGPLYRRPGARHAGSLGRTCRRAGVGTGPLRPVERDVPAGGRERRPDLAGNGPASGLAGRHDVHRSRWSRRPPGHLSRGRSASPSPRLRWLALLLASTWEMLRGDLATSETRAAEAARLGLAYGVRDATLAAAVHGFFQAFHTGALAPLGDLLASHAAGHPELPAWRAGAGLALASADERGRAAQLRDSMFPAVIRPGVDETWPVTACLTAQLCFDTAAPVGLCEALLAVLEPWAGRMAVLAGGVGECGPVSRYIGLLTARVDPTAGAAALKAAAEEARLFGATIWSERAEADLASISGGARHE